MLNGRRDGTRIGPGTILWRARELLAEKAIDNDEFAEMVTAGYFLRFEVYQSGAD